MHAMPVTTRLNRVGTRGRTSRGTHSAAAILLLALMPASTAQKKTPVPQNRSKSMTPANQGEMLSGDLGPVISRPELSMVVGRIEKTRWTRTVEDSIERDIGPLEIRVLEVVHGAAPHKDDLISVPARRVADPLIRVKNRHDYWNALRLNPGDTLLLALRPAEPNHWMAVAADQIESPAAPEVEAARRAYRIEEAPGDMRQKSQMLEYALTSNQDLLESYAVDSVTRHAGSDRDTGVDLLHKAILSPQTAPDRKLDLAFTLTEDPFLKREKKADAANQTVVATLATALVHERDPENAAAWARLLGSAVLMEYSADPDVNHKIMLELIGSPRNPPPQTVTNALSHVAAHGDAEDKEIANELLKAWRSR